MTREQLQTAIEEVIVEEIIERVCERLVTLQMKALVVCTGSGIATPDWTESLWQLQQEGFAFDLFLSHNAVQILDITALRQKLVFGQVWQGESGSAPEILAGEYQTIIVPAMTINTAAKVAGCTADTPASRIILTSMMLRKNVIIAVDGCCPDNDKRNVKGYDFTTPLKEQLRMNIQRMKEFGADIATARTLADKSLGTIGIYKAVSSCRSIPHKVQAGRHKIISRQDVAVLPDEGTLYIPKGSQITQLASDLARTRGITLIKE